MKENGFTLAEILVVLAVGALLLTGIASVLGGFGDTLRRTQKADKQLSQLANFDTVQQMLDSALYVDEQGELYPQSASRLEFRTAAPKALRTGGLRHVALLAVSYGERQDLLLDDLGSDNALPEASLLRGAENIAFETRIDATGPTQKPKVREVRIKLRLAGREAQIVSTPRITVQGPCVFDPISQSCRP